VHKWKTYSAAKNYNMILLVNPENKDTLTGVEFWRNGTKSIPESCTSWKP